MTINQISELGINGTSQYLNFLVAENRGIQEVQVNSIKVVDDKNTTFLLNLSAKLFDVESLEFKINTTGNVYSSESIKIVEYDADKRNLVVKPTPAFLHFFKGLNHHEIVIISNLRFLVERVLTWYKSKGEKIGIPTATSPLTLEDASQFLAGIPEPDEYQKKALGIIFETPFSYIWGAPGTGKTQYVLSYAILAYIRNKKQVLILAPTNNAIEQVLKGVISMTDRAGISREKVLRLGTPTSVFAERFPDVCELKGIQKQIAEIDKQIVLSKKFISYEADRRNLHKARI